MSLRHFQNLDMGQLHTVATAIVDYRGFRLLCQSIVPGILTHNPENSTKYGSINDGRTIRADEKFHTELERVYTQLHVGSSELVDDSEEPKLIHGPFDAKGLLGTD
jgi:protein TIF31